ncbi:MAG: acetylglutamate kinase, partial [Candidatus Latescibacterota bacterium]
MLEETAKERLFAGVVELSKTATVVVVHGGGPQSTEMAGRLGHTPTIVQGRRVTTDLDLEIALSTICGVVNSQLVAGLTSVGVRAVGLPGTSNRMISAVRRPPWNIDGEEVDFGHVGDIESVDTEVIEALLETEFVPVIASVGSSNDGALLNINADTTAAEIAIALKAKHLLIVTTSGGLRRDGDIVNRCNETLSESGIADGWISDGMHVKLQTGLKAAKSGVKQVHIVAPGSLTDPDAGTLLVSDQVSGQMSGRASAVSVVQHSPRDPIEILQTLIRFPSITGNEAEIADWVEAWAHSTGLGVGRFENSVYCWLGDGDDCLLLNSHLDVVPPSSDHPYEPFDPMEVDGRIYGRGSVDAKASGAAMLAALASLTAEGWEPVSGRLLLALTECEEGTGKNNGLQRLLPHLPPATGAIVGEPTSLQPCTSQKGMLILKATAAGKTAHAARPGLGENAIAKAARDIAVLQNLDFDRTHPDLGPITVAVTTIAGGTARNVIPEECTFFIDIRTTPAYTHDEIISYLPQRLESTLSVHSGRYV